MFPIQMAALWDVWVAQPQEPICEVFLHPMPSEGLDCRGGLAAGACCPPANWTVLLLLFCFVFRLFFFSGDQDTGLDGKSQALLPGFPSGSGVGMESTI